MICLVCGGWGKVFRVRTAPPSSPERRVKFWKELLKLVSPGQLAEQVCTSCGGYGQRPETR